MTKRTLDDKELGTIINGLAAAEVMRKRILADVVAGTKGIPASNELKQLLDQQQRDADALKDLLEGAGEIEIHPRD